MYYDIISVVTSILSELFHNGAGEAGAQQLSQLGLKYHVRRYYAAESATPGTTVLQHDFKVLKPSVRSLCIPDRTR